MLNPLSSAGFDRGRFLARRILGEDGRPARSGQLP